MAKQIIAVAFILITAVVSAQDKTLSSFEGKSVDVSTASLRDRFRHFSTFTLESKKLSQFVHQNSVSSFRLKLGSDKLWDIDLKPSGIKTSNYHLKVLTPQGIKSVISQPDFLFKGKVKGSSKDEQVRLSIREGFIYGSIQFDGREYFIEPINRFSTTKEKDQYIIYEAKDLINTESISCDFQDKKTLLKEAEQQNALKEQSPQDIICKKLKFISVADYSLYQKFGNDVNAVETAFLSILNLAEGNYATLNFGADGSTDVGTDKFQFEMEEVVVSTCKECDIAPGIENASTIGNNLLSWASKNIDQRGGKIIQHWTANSLFDITGKGLSGTISSPSNCYGIAGEILRYGTDDLSFLRLLVAHETGHALGCPHDDLIKSDVTSFIMYSGANGSRTRFSTLADFGGINYSSQQTIRNTVLSNISCLQECGNNPCEDVKDLKIDYSGFNDDVHLSWTGSGNYLIRYKVNDSSYYDSANIKQTSLNTVSLKDLDPCTLYKFEIQRNCGSAYSRSSSLIFKTASLTVSSKSINLHGDKYDVELDVDCKRCSDKEYFIRIDAKPYKFANSNSLKQVIIKNLFADGARHRIDISKDSGNFVCASTSFYTAPYYRSTSKKILSVDFNDCGMPLGWKDSLLAKRNPSAPNAHWIVSPENFFTPRTIRGNLDSTCMIYYNNFSSPIGTYSGALSLRSPIIDLSKYKEIKLHFDYNFLGYKFSAVSAVGSITVEAFDGANWQKIAERQADIPPVPIRNIWDSVPQRVFVDLDNFNNKDFQLRFIVDDGSLINKATLGVFAAFDNIVVDGYLKDSPDNNIVVYPNPANDEVLIQFSRQPVSINYRIIDVSGRIVSNGMLNNYRIDLNRMSSGMYLLVLYENDKILATKKILKQ